MRNFIEFINKAVEMALPLNARLTTKTIRVYISKIYKEEGTYSYYISWDSLKEQTIYTYLCVCVIICICIYVCIIYTYMYYINTYMEFVRVACRL